MLTDTSGWEIQGKGYLAIQEYDSGWDYTVCDLDFHEIDGGQIDAPELSMLAVRNVILPFVDHFPTDLELYRIMTTKLSEVAEAKAV
nr:LPD16 domain-containing protein [Pseudoflavonifractor phocaeensis]